MEIQVTAYCKGKLVEIIEQRRITQGDEINIQSKAGGGQVTIKIESIPKGVESMELRVNLDDTAILDPSMVPPDSTRMRKLGFKNGER